MNRTQITTRTQVLVRDFGASTFRVADIYEFINEGIERVQQVIVECAGMTTLSTSTDVPTHLPLAYHHLLAIYAASRCEFQDERHYQATNLMNEFEFKLEELKSKIEAGEVTIVDALGVAVVNENEVDFVETESYWGDYHTGGFETADTELEAEIEDIEHWFTEV